MRDLPLTHTMHLVPSCVYLPSRLPIPAARMIACMRARIARASLYGIALPHRHERLAAVDAELLIGQAEDVPDGR